MKNNGLDVDVRRRMIFSKVKINSGQFDFFYFLNVQYDNYITFKNKIFQKICKYYIVLKHKKILNLQKKKLYLSFFWLFYVVNFLFIYYHCIFLYIIWINQTY